MMMLNCFIELAEVVNSAHGSLVTQSIRHVKIGVSLALIKLLYSSSIFLMNEDKSVCLAAQVFNQQSRDSLI